MAKTEPSKEATLVKAAPPNAASPPIVVPTSKVAASSGPQNAANDANKGSTAVDSSVNAIDPSNVNDLNTGETAQAIGMPPIILDEEVPLPEQEKPIEAIDFHTLRRTVQEQQARDLPAPARPVLKRIPEVTDDFIRNFLLRNNMRETLETFEMEWYERFGSKANPHVPQVPDNYIETTSLLNRVEELERELRQNAELTTQATREWAQVKKERDFHRTNHNRVVQEKNKLAKLLKRAHHNAEEANPTILELQSRCETLMKSKSLVAMERDKLESKVSILERRIKDLEEQIQINSGSAENEEKGGSEKEKKKVKKQVITKTIRHGANANSKDVVEEFTWPPDDRPRPNPDPSIIARAQQSMANPVNWTPQFEFQAHSMTVTKIALHPQKPAVASCSDDGTWRLSALPHGDVILTGDGHKNWISSIAMHPGGIMVATGSGDKTIKLWDFASNRCSATLSAHTDGVWSVNFQETGTLLASGSLDQTARVWDVETGQCRQALRGHLDAVNAVMWKPYTNTLCTCSGDKTLSLWDVRVNSCVQTFYGHRSTVLSLAIPTLGGGADEYALASSDAEGIVALWDIRKIEKRLVMNCGPHAVNYVSFDFTGKYIALSSDDSSVKILDLTEEVVNELPAGHEEPVQCAVFDPATNNFLVSCGADRTIRYWC